VYEGLTLSYPVQQSEREINAQDGYGIDAMIWRTSNAPKAVVQISHGRGEHAQRYRYTAEYLARAGYVVLAANHRGHGCKAAREGSLGTFGSAGFDALVSDLACVSRQIRETYDLPLLMLAHSMGSFAAQYFLTEHSDLIDGLVLSGSAAMELRRSVMASGISMDYNANVQNPRTPYDWLSRDARVVDDYIADPLCGFDLDAASQTAIYARSDQLLLPDVYRTVRRNLPIALFTGDSDPVNHYLLWFYPLLERYRSLGFVDVSAYIFGGARHEPLNEINREEVHACLLAWLNRVVQSIRSKN